MVGIVIINMTWGLSLMLLMWCGCGGNVGVIAIVDIVWGHHGMGLLLTQHGYGMMEVVIVVDMVWLILVLAPNLAWLCMAV